MIGSINSSEKFAVTKANFASNDECIPDRTGEAYIFGNRNSIFYNPQFEEAAE
jgi:hypothetical protein